jgi:endonuclease/exonuclease/phosphatase (EEP) superfamily protein YafD
MLLTLASLSVFLAEHWWVAELFSHLRLYYAIALLACVTVLLWLRPRIAALCLLPMLFNLVPLVPLYLPASAVTTGQKWTLIHYNLDRSAVNHDTAFAYLRAQNAQILLLQEVTPALQQRFVSELPAYDVAAAQPMDNTQGSALLVHRAAPIELQESAIIALPEYSTRPLLSATLTLGEQQLRLLSMQATRPQNAATSAFQGIELDAFATWSRAQHADGTALLLVGDINTTPWSARFQHLLKRGQLRDSAAGYGLQGNWPASFPPLLRLPIDHCLVNAQIAVVARSSGPALGGDHTPLLLTFVIRE